MHTVTSLDNAKSYGGRGRTSHDPSEASSASHRNPSDSALVNPALSQDNVDLSTETKQSLEELTQQLKQAIGMHPQYSHLLGNQSASHTSVVSRVQRFLSDPHLQRLAGVNGEFGAFYRRIETLGGQIQTVIAEMRQNGRANPAGTYERPRGLT